MRLPADSKSKYFRCVKCGSYVDRKGVRKRDTQKLRRSGLKLSSGRSVHRSGLLGVFVDGGLISPQQGEEAASAAKENKEKTYSALVRLGFASRDQLHAFLARESGAAAISLAHFSIEQSVAAMLPREMVLSQLILPIDKLGKSLTVAMVCPMDTNAIKRAEEHTNLRVRPMLCTWDDFDLACAKLYPDHRAQGDASALSADETEAPLEYAPVPQKKEKPPVEEVASEKSWEDNVLDRPLDMEQGEPLSDRIRQLRALEIPQRLMNRLDAILDVDPDGLKKITAIISNSPAFCAKILSMANSKAYGMEGKVDSVPMAVALLGAETIALIATGTPKKSAQWEQGLLPLRYFSRHVAKINATLAALSEITTPQSAWCIGLLHGLGCYALCAADPEKYQKIDPRSTGFARADLENKLLGMTHAEAGWHLAKAWHMPELVMAGMTHYLRPENTPEHKDIAYMLHMAVTLADPKGLLKLEKLQHCKEAMHYLKLSEKDTKKALQQSPWLAPAKKAK